MKQEKDWEYFISIVEDALLKQSKCYGTLLVGSLIKLYYPHVTYYHCILRVG